jgi:hypothetical protein
LVEEQVAHVAEDLVARQRDVDERLHHRPRDLVHHPVDREDAIEVPLGDIGKRQELEGFPGGCAVDDEDVELALALVLLDPHEAGDLLHPRRRCHLLGDDVVDSLRCEERRQVHVDAVPVLLELVERVDLLAPEVRRELGGLVADRRVDAVREAVRSVGADDERLVAEACALDRGGGGDRCLAHPSLARVEDHTHGCVSLLTG